MDFIDITATLEGVDFYPSNIYTEIIQNVKTILTTTKFSVPLDRDFGIDASLLDSPLPVAQARLTAEIFDAIQKYEPRAKVKKVFYAGDPIEGKLIPTVRVVIR
ncbi:GPW/gp25 family protein [Selenomonadales bacterium OttesenSCG-928-I06]|nr:GPW/gp25 family protein [Selenomonadales bacterium OttesenSCG-928-I06]